MDEYHGNSATIRSNERVARLKSAKTRSNGDVIAGVMGDVLDIGP